MKNIPEEKPKFKIELFPPYSTFQDGKPIPIPYVIEGLLTQGGFSILGAKPKVGKSSFSRYEAVCVTKGVPCLGRETVKGDVVLISLEDPRNHVDNCLKALGYDAKSDGQIYIIDKLASTARESVEALGDVLAEHRDVKLVVIDNMPKLLRVKDLNDYMPVMNEVEMLHDLARKFAGLHIQGVGHCRKASTTEDRFDSLLGSTALRGETDTNIVMYQEDNKRVFATETRIGKAIRPTIIGAQMVDSGDAEVVADFYLEGSFEEYKKENKAKCESQNNAMYEDRIIEHLKSCEGVAGQEQVLKDVEGKRENLRVAIQRLTEQNVLSVSGVSRSPVNPLTLKLNVEQLSTYYLCRGDWKKASSQNSLKPMSSPSCAGEDIITTDSLNAEEHAA